ncbi:MAG: hypothetical protein HYV09_29970 [Deltaproteobacteria bacterium]|nr:hypothetical protein [Deltaproteobacteria bacterium]
MNRASSLGCSVLALAFAALAWSGGCSSESSDASCYSPSSNLDRAYAAGSRGCACSGGAVCVSDSTGRTVALVCESGAWQAVEDGPCMPGPGPFDGGGDGVADGTSDGNVQGDAASDAAGDAGAAVDASSDAGETG